MSSREPARPRGLLRSAAVAVAGLALAVPLLAGCTSGSASDASTATPTGAGASAPQSKTTELGGGDGEQQSPPTRSTIVTTPTPTLTTQSNVAEVDGACPYISAQQFADAEGDRVGRVTLLQTKPVGCRFYFSYDETQIVGEIHVETFSTPTEAYNAMVVSANGHPEVQSSHIGDDAVAFKTELQGEQTWQCVFAKGSWVVTVRTRQTYPALNAFNLARVIAANVP